MFNAKNYALGFNSHAVPHASNSVKTLLVGASTTTNLDIPAKRLTYFSIWLAARHTKS